jgi:hypothetical protein
MADINQNIKNAYRSMYEQKEEVLDETNKNDKSDDGDGLDAVQPKAVKKKFDDRKDKDIDNDGDVDSSDKFLHKRRKAVSKAMEKEGNAFSKALMAAKEKGEKKFKVGDKEYDVQSELNKLQKESFSLDDIREMCHSKDHDCATYVDHPEFGLGKPVYESHAIPNDDGSVDWYDVEFAHGIEKEVPAEDMQILQTEAHKEKVHKDDDKMIKSQKKKMKEEDEEEEEPKMMDSDENPMKKKKKPMVPDADKPSEDDAEEDKPKVGVEKPEDKKKKKTSGNAGEKEAEISKIGEGTIKVDDYEGSSAGGRNAKKLGIKIKKISSSPFGGDNVQMSGPDAVLIKFAKGNLGVSAKAKTIKDVQKELSEAAQVSDFTNLLNELMAVDAVGKKKKEKDGSEPEEKGENNPEGETDFVDAHGKKDVVVDGEKAIDDTSKTAKDTKPGKHVKQQQAKGDSKPIKSTEAPVKGEKEPKEGEGKKSIKTENTLMDLAIKALSGKNVPEMRKIVASAKEDNRNPFDARTKDAKSFLERMAKRKNGDKGTMVKDNDPKDLPMQPKELPKTNGEK